jgi:hypothetical protein
LRRQSPRFEEADRFIVVIPKLCISGCRKGNDTEFSRCHSLCHPVQPSGPFARTQTLEREGGQNERHNQHDELYFLLHHARPSLREEGNIISHATVPKTDPAEELRLLVFALACDMEEPLDQALAFANALDLMGFGLNSIGDDHGPALLAIAEALTGQLTAAKKPWWQIMAASRHRAPSRRIKRRSRTA